MKHFSTKFVIASILSLSILLFFFYSPPALDSANLTSVANTLQSSRLSWGARVEADGTDVGGSRVQIQSAPATPLNSTSTSNLHAGDSILINTNSYTVVGILDADEFTVTPVIVAGDADDGDPIYLEQKPRHVITFTTASAVADGYFRILIPADSTGDNDGNLDDDGFDFGAGSIDVVASDTGNYDFVTGVATDSGSTGCTSPSNYHCFEAHYSGNGGIGTAITFTIGNTNGTNTLVAPGEADSHTEATADTLSFIVKNYDANDVEIDTTTGKIALIEAVRVTATVDPTISFSIAGVGIGTTACGVPTDVTSTALTVPFGTLVLNTFKDLAQKLTVSTNADGGYAVTSSEDDELGKDGATSPAIADTDCDGEDCTISSDTEWNTASDNGFGYSLDNSVGTGATAPIIAFEYDDGALNFSARPFANIAGSDSPIEIFSSTDVADTQNIYACYRLSIGATQEAGDYENQIIYTATATF
ncbi:MAG: hypothetical protein U9Q63_04245 [Patescibacteria group bacterium]|nr:hypothetical protein [Patescibacteria group bacterium]